MTEVQYVREGKWWIALIEKWTVSGYGRTKNDALAMLKAALVPEELTQIDGR